MAGRRRSAETSSPSAQTALVIKPGKKKFFALSAPLPPLVAKNAAKAMPITDAIAFITGFFRAI